MSKGFDFFKLDGRGVLLLLKSEKTQEVVSAYADKIKAQCGSGYAKDKYKGRYRVNASVYPETKEAEQENLKHNTLLKVIHR